jgi:hypothetical protein
VGFSLGGELINDKNTVYTLNTTNSKIAHQKIDPASVPERHYPCSVHLVHGAEWINEQLNVSHPRLTHNDSWTFSSLCEIQHPGVFFTSVHPIYRRETQIDILWKYMVDFGAKWGKWERGARVEGGY